MAVKASSETTLTRVDDGATGATGAKGADGKMLYATSSTAAATAAKVATLSSGTLTLTAGATVSVKFTYGNTATSPTLNISGTGAKAIYTQGVRYAYWQAGATVVFVYDGAYWRVASEPVYANTVTVGNASGNNVYIDSDSLDIRKGSTVLATFGEKTIELGKNSVTSEISLCNDSGYIVGSIGETGRNIAIGTTGGPSESGLYNGGMSLNMAKYGYIDATNLTINADNSLTLESGTIHIAEGNDEATRESVTLTEYIRDLIYPVGSIKMTITNTNPSTYLGGTWTAWGSGKVPVGVDASDTDFKTVEKTGGEKTHTLTVDEMPAHTHTMWDVFSTNATGSAWIGAAGTSTGTSYATSSTGGGGAHNNLQPYITCYMWKRTA